MRRTQRRTLDDVEYNVSCINLNKNKYDVYSVQHEYITEPGEVQKSVSGKIYFLIIQ